MPRVFYLYITTLLTCCIILIQLIQLPPLYGDPKKTQKTKASSVKIDGSSTVFLITEAVAEEFLKENPRIRVVIGVSGTGGGFKKFIRGDIDIINASRKIKEIEVKEVQEKNIQYLEIPIAYDGISIVTNKANNWVDFLTSKELKKVWQPGSTVKTWKDIRASWPSIPVRLYGPGTDSGTFDYFTAAINGKTQASRPDFNRSEDDNVLVQGVAGDRGALGYFGYAYYIENKKKIKLIPVKHNGPARYPTISTIKNGNYSPLSRPLFIYVNKASLSNPNVKAFLKFYLKKVASLLNEIGYIPLPKEGYASSLYTLEN